MKGLLVSKGIQFDKNHDLAYLINFAKDGESISQAVNLSCNRLSQHGVSTRYPGKTQVNESDAKTAIKDMNKIGVWVKNQFEKMREQEEKEQKKSAEKSQKAKDDNYGYGR